MEGLCIVIAIIWFVARVVNKDKAGKTGKNSGKMEKMKAGLNTERIREAAKELREALETPEENAEAPRPVAQAAVPDGGPTAAAIDWAQARNDEILGEGDSRLDDEGCVGGSLEHGHEEGTEAQVARGAQVARRDAGVEASTPRVRMTAAQMRQAVIASEVLRAPLSLRGKRNGFAR